MRSSHQILLVVMTVFLLGCGTSFSEPERITSGYGRKSGSDFVNSLNGTAVFAEMVRASGATTSRADSITPRIRNVDQIIWFRDRFEPPTQEAIDALLDWVNSGQGRELIVVGRDSDSAIDYWTQVAAAAQGQDKIKARRRLATNNAEFNYRRSSRNLAEVNCAWYSLQENEYQTATRISGDWSTGIDPQKANLKVGIMLDHGTPNPSLSWNKRYQPSVLLEVDEKPMVTVLRPRSDRAGQIVLVSNASFLTNYGLVNRENQKLAQRLIDFTPKNQTTLFLETGSEEVRVSDSETGHETWAWITKPPLRYIIPHFLMLGVLFCFVLFPIFGRARRADPSEDYSTFRDHIRAMGKLMSISGNTQFARSKIDKYINRHQKENKK